MDQSDPRNYRFDDYLAALGDDWLADDPLLRRWLARSRLDRRTRATVDAFGRDVATRYREIADVVERRENLPYLAGKGPYNRPSSEVVVPPETRSVLGEVHGSGIWKQDFDERARYAVVYLLNQNGEAGVTCGAACTDGMARALRRFGKDPRSRGVIEALERATRESWIHGAQFVTEVQGGSDAATNRVVAEPADDGLYRLSGPKWFCSNVIADYWMITARVAGGPQDHRGIGLFCVPRRWDQAANGHRIERLKDKLGTRALPTAEIELDGALGWPVGPLDEGLKNMVAIVLTTSRIHNMLGAAAIGRRAAREARAYAGFRRAFGKKLAEHPLVEDSLRRLTERADRVEAGAFAVVDSWLSAMRQPNDRAQALWTRVLISLAKAVTARGAVDQAYQAMMIFGGNGIEERFCALPRLWRDAAIMETWEGPYTLLLMQALGDLAKYDVAGGEAEFLRRGLGDRACEEDRVALAEILGAPTREEHVLAWAELAPRLYHRFEERALAELRG